MKHRPYSLEKLQEIAQGDQAFINDMLVTFVENVTDDIKEIQSLRLVEEWKAIAAIAHRLATRFAYLNVDSLQALSVDIEKSVLNYGNFAGIAEKAGKLCDETIVLIDLLKKDFELICID